MNKVDSSSLGLLSASSRASPASPFDIILTQARDISRVPPDPYPPASSCPSLADFTLPSA